MVVGLPSPWLPTCRRDDLHIRQSHGRALARSAAFLALGTATAGTVKKYVGHVRALHHERFGVEYLDGLVHVQRVLEGLANREASLPSGPESRRKAPFTWGMFQQAAPILRQGCQPDDREMLVAIGVGLGFLLRASELLPDGKTLHFLRRQDVVFGPRVDEGVPLWVAVNIRSSKMHKTRKLRALAQTSDPVGVCRLLWEWHTHTGGYARPLDPLFPVVTRSRLSLRLRGLAAQLGMGDAHRLASHSLRRGGATSLLASGVPPHVIQRFGRWASAMWVDTYAELQFDRQLALATALEGQPRSLKYGCTITEDFFSACLARSAGLHVGVGGVVADGAEVGVGGVSAPIFGIKSQTPHLSERGSESCI